AKACLTGQMLDADAVNAQIAEIIAYKGSALHWNRTLFETRFADTYRRALDAYEAIEASTGVRVHDRNAQEKYVDSVVADYETFRDLSLRGSASAAIRESATVHRLEHLAGGEKAILAIENYLGGTYHLTADEAIVENGKMILQESKNATKGALPSLGDIKDGLFKLILYSNLDKLEQNGKPVAFATRLKLTGTGVSGSVRLPCEPGVLADFYAANAARFTARHKLLIALLGIEATANGFSVEIRGNAA
ncbi:MAG: hypothetical protein H7Y38_11810, partial [Armatimonadetes bacterium]|nr:hypothetical protein [Armatimonadota bacterium]